MSRSEAQPSLYRNRDFLLLWSGQTLSTLGTRISTIAVPLIVLRVTGSPARAGLAGFVSTLPYLLFYLPAGAIVDRSARKAVMLWCDAVRIAALGSIAVAAWTGRLTYSWLLIAGFTAGTAYVFFSVTEKSVLPSLVSSEQLTPALAQQEAKTRGASLVGPPLGGILYAVSPALPFLADALSYVVSSAGILFIRTDLRGRRDTGAGALHTEILIGLRWLVREPFIRITLACMALENIMFQAFNLILIVRCRDLGAASAMTGIVLGFIGVGGLAGALAAPALQRRLRAKVVVIGSTWAWAALLVPVAFLPTPLSLTPVVAAMSFIGPVWNVAVVGYQYTVIPTQLLGRVKSIILLVSWGAIPFGSLLAGWLLARASFGASIAVLSVLTIAVALIATTSRGIRKSF